MSLFLCNFAAQNVNIWIIPEKENTSCCIGKGWYGKVCLIFYNGAS